MMLLGVPLYVCASASVPIAAGLIHAGASPGAALAFLISGPATNAATITTVWKLLGQRTALLYLLAVVISAVGGGLLLDWLMPAMHAVVPPLADHAHETMGIGLAFGVLGDCCCWRYWRSPTPQATARPKYRRRRGPYAGNPASRRRAAGTGHQRHDVRATARPPSLAL